MWGRLKTLVLAGVVATAALVPLFGDPRVTPVTHSLWARLLLRSMDIAPAVRTSTAASQVFSTLAWNDSLSYPAENYLRADGVVVRDEGGQRFVAAGATPAEVVYPLAVVQPGNYQLRARIEGAPQSPASAELVPLDGGDAVSAFTLVPAAEASWVFAGTTHLDPGAYGASFLLPPGCAMSQVEIAPPCLNSIEPPGGWQAEAVTTTFDLSVTALKALDAEYELAPDASPIEVGADTFQIEAPVEAVEVRASAPTLGERALRADRKGLRAVTAVNIPEAGLYTVSAFIRPGNGQRWLVDGCRKAIVCPGPATGWRPILTQSFSAGRHTIQVGLASDSVLESLRIEKKKTASTDYRAALGRVGFDAGPDGPVSPDAAIGAMRFVRNRRQQLRDQLCGDTVLVDDSRGLLPPPTVAQVPLPLQQAPTGPGAVAPVTPPLGPPILPPQPPASPTSPTGGGL